MSWLEIARQYLAAGLCVLPARRDQKRPTVPWKAFQSRLPTAAEVDAWFGGGQTGLCILTGKISGNHELIDFDQRGALFDAWCDKVGTAMPGLIERLVICKTQHDGRHVPYCLAGEVCGNMKLAQRRGPDGKIVTLIETRGEGGLYLCAPTPGYAVIQGDLCKLPVLTEEERGILLQAAWELNEHLPPVVDGPKTAAESGRMSADPANSGPSPAERPHSGALSTDNRPYAKESPVCASHSSDSAACATDNSENGALSANMANSRATPADSAAPGPTPAYSAPTTARTAPKVAACATDSSNSSTCSAENSHSSGLSTDSAACATDPAHSRSLSVNSPACQTDNSETRPCAADNSDRSGSPPENPDNAGLSADSAGCAADQTACAADRTDLGRSLANRPPGGVCPSNRPDRPGDDFNIRGDVRAVLEQHGWQCTKGGTNEHWRRPDKTCGSNSATLKDRVFYVFSSNAAPFEPNQGYSPFAVYTLLEYGGNYEQAARSLRTLGYGGDCLADTAADVDISAIVGRAAAVSAESAACAAAGPAPGEQPLEVCRLSDLITNFTALNPPVIRGLLREGETMNIIASPKVGKSWLVSGLAIAVASGLDWLGFGVEQGRVLHIDNELHANTSAYRYREISDHMHVAPRLYADNIDVVSLRGQLRDLHALGRHLAGVAPGYYKLVIIDAFYRTLPAATDENDNGAIAGLYNVIDGYAARLGCAFVLIHHSSKGNQAGKAVTDVGAGAGSQSRAADTHLVLRPHEEDGVFIVEAAVRSWPPIDPLALRFEWPLFIPTTEVDTSALLGAVKPKAAKAIDTPLEEFVEQCVAVNDPCSQRSVIYEARQRFGLSERKAEETLDLAIERNLAARIRTGAQMRYVKVRPGVSGDKALWTAALLAHDPEGDTQKVADAVGATRQYVNQVRRQMDGNCLETDGN